MKIKAINSTLSCITKYIGFLSSMINKKIFLGLVFMYFLNGCTSPTALLGPVYTFTSTGNIYQAGLSVGSNHLITSHTGKTPIENIKDISESIEKKNKNIQQQTLESEDFYFLVKNKIEKTSNILNLTNQ